MARATSGVAQRDRVKVGEVCPVCLDYYHGGAQIYQGVDGLWRAACADEHACLAAYREMPDPYDRVMP